MNTTIQISQTEITKWNDLLMSENIDFEKDGIVFSPFSCIKKWTATFSNGYFVDLNINTNGRNDNTIYCEALLFDEEGHLIYTNSDTFYEIDGIWYLYDGKDEYILNVFS